MPTTTSSRGGDGADPLDGGDGIDTASYAGSASRVDVRLSGTVVNYGDATGDVLTNIENLVGSAHNDILAGDRQANTLGRPGRQRPVVGQQRGRSPDRRAGRGPSGGRGRP